jgi:hypothetical protein
MAICQIFDHPDLTADHWAQLMHNARATGPVLPDGARLVLAGPADPGWRVISVWDSEDARDQFFAERLTPIYERAGLSLDNVKRTSFDVHTLIAGDLIGTPHTV